MGNRLSGLFGGTSSKDSKNAQAIRLQTAEGTIDALSRSQAVIEFELDGTILDANDNFLSVMGYSLDEVKGQHHSIFVDASQKNSPEYSQFWQRLGRGEFIAQEFKRSAKGGKDVWIQASYNPILGSDGKPYRVVKFATDITEQRIESANSSGQLAAIGKSNAVIEFSLDGSILTANDNFLVTMGYQFNEIQGKQHKIFLDSEYANSSEYRHFWDALRRGEYQAGEFRRIGKSGEEVWIQASYNPIMDASGTPFKVVKYATNVTEQKNLQQTIESVLKETKSTVSAMAQGDLTTRMNGNFTGQFGELQDSVNECVERMHSALSEIRTLANGVTTESADIVEGTSNLSERTVMQAANLEETAASMEEITITVKGNAANASTANDLALSASQQAKVGVGIVRDAVRAMDGLNESSGKISEIIGVINDIAFQTNLLALNASVEAARAGSQGRGFAVVASEVRDLAGRSATAAKEIKELIEDSANRVSESSVLVNKSGASLNDIVAGVEEVSTIIGHISTASGEQSLGVSLVNNAITQIDELTQQNGSLVEQATSASKNLDGQATELARLVASFTLHDSIDQPRHLHSVSSVASNESSLGSQKRAHR